VTLNIEDLKYILCRSYEEKTILNHSSISKIISNYTNHIANTPIDAPFQKLLEKREVQNIKSTDYTSDLPFIRRLIN